MARAPLVERGPSACVPRAGIPTTPVRWSSPAIAAR